MLTFKIILQVATCLLLFNEVAAAKCTRMLTQQFNHYSKTQQYSKKMVIKDFPKTRGPYKMIIDGDQGKPQAKVGNKVITGYFPKGKISGKQTGFTWYSLLSKPSTEMYMSYRLKFSKGFQWKKGGKLPGLCGGEGRGTACPAGCSKVTRDRGFSTRLMWREGGRLVTYAYYPDKPSRIRCGEDWKWSKKVQSGKWYFIQMWVKLNTPGKKNGEFKAWLDGKLVLHQKKIPYRYKSSFLVSRAYITTYAGGSSVRHFAPSKNQNIEFDDFRVWSGNCGVRNQAALDFVDDPPEDVDGFQLYKERGWDVLGEGDLAFVPTPDTNITEAASMCADKCAVLDNCNLFSLSKGGCTMKKDTGALPTWVGQANNDEWVWLYTKTWA